MNKIVFVVLMIMSLSGCTTNGVYDGTKTWTLIGGVVVAGAIAANEADNGNSSSKNCHIVWHGDGTDTRVCN